MQSEQESEKTTDSNTSSSSLQNDSQTDSAGKGATTNIAVKGKILKHKCIRTGCNNMAVESEDWQEEYCSSDCVVSHCRSVFNQWLETHKVTPTNN